MCGRYADGRRYTDEGIDGVQKGRKLQEATCLYENISNTTFQIILFTHAFIHFMDIHSSTMRPHHK